ncbi:DUF3871 family protein [Mucilaginibacter flavidus]|uniref:DUF3871 family protein n=1 Tax=Mucilaginibacter flavidus TaxID=2949309 RepID=UPI002092DC6E|nr:DUF3871 family protein [Mucilaginibacter flavidus]MCO5950853.1 DUF3871 family protein [Mucilaginibacter flavidus]
MKKELKDSSVMVLSEPIKTMEHRALTEKTFIEANTLPVTLDEIKMHHVIPVFIKDNEPVISHSDFIEVMQEVAGHAYKGETILQPAIRMSHPIKGRIPEAKHKTAKDLLESEKTIYYERMAFAIEIPTIYDEISGQQLSLTIGGIKAYNLDNMYARKGSDEHFKLFIGFENKVCTNLCIWSDGFVRDLKVKSIKQLMDGIYQMISLYNAERHIQELKQLPGHSLTEQQFALLIGRARLYPNLPNHLKKDIPELLFNDTQLGTLVRDYYKDDSFSRNDDGSVNLWNLYNLFTGVNKSSYIDSFLDKSHNASLFTRQLLNGLQGSSDNWFLT